MNDFEARLTDLVDSAKKTVLPEWRGLFDLVVAAARRAEREACAVAAETGYDDMVESDYDSGFNEGRTTAADRIRERV